MCLDRRGDIFDDLFFRHRFTALFVASCGAAHGAEPFEVFKGVVNHAPGHRAAAGVAGKGAVVTRRFDAFGARIREISVTL